MTSGADRVLGTALLALLAAAAGLTAQAEPERLGAAPVELGPAPAGWERQDLAPVAGETVVRHVAGDVPAFVEARVFPAAPGERALDAVLRQAVSHWFRTAHGLSGPAVGFPELSVGSLWGCPSADATLSTAWKGEPAAGRARLLRVNEHQWALALGVGPRTDREVQRAVSAFVEGLHPTEPRFYDPRFMLDGELERVEVQESADRIVRSADVLAAVGAIELALGTRLALGQRAYVEHALRADLTQGGERSQRGFIDVGAFVRSAMERDASTRDAEVSALGKRILEAMVERAERDRYAPAIQLLAVLDRLTRTVVGDASDGLRQIAAGSALEALAFFASVALDAPVTVSESDRAHWLEALGTAWPTLSPEERAAWRESGRTWADLRRAWDLARPQARAEFRRQVALRLAGAAAPEEPALLRDARALKTWMDARDEALRAATLRAALALGVREQAALAALLEVKADGYHLGW